MLDNRDPAHYLQALKSTTTPKRLLWLDCASSSTKEQGAFVERWAGGALGRTHYTSRKGKRVDETTLHDGPLALWEDADRFCVANRRTVLWAYDLAKQLRISQALVHLPALGWHLDKIVLERTAAWALLTNDKRTLLMCDIKSWAPVEFGKLANDVGFSELAGREFYAGNGYRSDVCKWRVGVLRDCVLQIFAWIEGENLGPFRPTGSGQSYAAYRRRFMKHKLLVHDDMPRLEAERAAMWTGRCEAWQHGQLTNGPYVEYDMHAAYCTIAAECEVPTVAHGGYGPRDIDKLVKALDRYAVLAHVRVTTDIPCLPARMAGRTVWPVGTFDTWLWSPELSLAIDYANELYVHKSYLYHTEPALRKFANFVLDGLQPQTQIYGLVPKRVMKHWSRCLVGRLGLRYRSWQRFGSQPEPDLRLVTFLDVDENTSTDMLIAGHDRLILADMAEALDSMPQIPSWVMSECRRRLWVAIASVGQVNVVYVDTDSIVVRSADGHRIRALDDATLIRVWDRKGEYKRMTIHGPRNLVAESDRRVAGLPLTAKQVAPLEFSGQVMRSIKESMRAGELDCVANIPRKFVLHTPDMRRQHLPDHKTAPFTVQLPERELML